MKVDQIKVESAPKLEPLTKTVKAEKTEKEKLGPADEKFIFSKTPTK